MNKLIYIIILLPLIINISSNDYKEIKLEGVNTNLNEFGARFVDSSFYYIQEANYLDSLKRRNPRPWTNYIRHNIKQLSLNKGLKPKLVEIVNVKELYDFTKNDSIQYQIRGGNIYYKKHDGYEILPFCGLDYQFYSIYLSRDSLFFSSNLELDYSEKKSDLDIYMYFHNDERLIPIKLKEINTEECDEAYYFKIKSKIYFSRRCGNNDFDIYEYDLDTKEELKLPFPINSEYDDIFYRENDDGYCILSSNRTGGEGKFDLYLYKKK